ncbi:MAG: pyrroloquinoline quinone biosynthesis peptide chaperone PqqD [Paracoccaceae bacterium]
MSPDAVPALPSGVRLHRCAVREAWFLLAPERALKLDAIGHAILSRVDGEQSLAAIVADLAASFGAPPEQVETDVVRFLGDLSDRMVLVIRAPA